MAEHVAGIEWPVMHTHMRGVHMCTRPISITLDVMEETERQEDSARVGGRVAATGATWWIISGTPRVVELATTGSVLGRSGAEHDAIAFEDPRMSRAHARIAYAPGWELTDLGSRNGTFLDGAVVAPSERRSLHDGDLVRLGNTVGVFRTYVTEAIDRARDSAFPGWSLAARAVRARVEFLQSAGGHVLVHGETGVGKERVSRAIAGPRVVVVNCAELRRDLVRSELFGHVRGAFSGAATSHTGLVEAAAGGALFFDEIGELPLDAQADLLRFLEDGSYRPVGANTVARSDARVIAATNRDLDHEASTGRFRRDLLARLRMSNLPLELPALTDRREDVIAWASHFVHEAVGRDPTWSPGAVECLALYGWPDNLRELRGVVRGILEARGGEVERTIEATELPGKLVEHRRLLREAREPGGVVVRDGEPTAGEVAAALGATGGNMKAAAQALGIDRRKLYRLCEQHGLNIETFRKGE